MIKFNSVYVLLSVIIFLGEILIAEYMHDAIIRPFGGDFWVVMLIYCMVKSILNKPAMPVAIGVLVFAFVVEITQYFHLINLLGLQQSRAAVLILGTSFSFTDLLCYTLGILLVIILEKIKHLPATPYNPKNV